MSDLKRIRREMDKVLRKPGAQPDRSTQITRRTFLHKSLLTGAAAGAAGAATYGWFPLINTIDIAHAAMPAFKFAWISDTHLYPKDVNTRFVEKATRAVKEVQAMATPADFLIFGGDLAQLGDPVELDLGNEILKEVTIKKYFIPGEHDWYLDMGKKFTSMFGQSPWSFDHKGVHFVGLDTVSRAPDYWTAKGMSPEERMGHMSALDGTVAGAWAGVGKDQLDWLTSDLSGVDKAAPIVIFTHNPLWECYPPWNFWVRDWRDVHSVIGSYSNVTNIHGHVHQPLYNEIGSFRSIGMLATSWPWPYAPTGVPELTKPMIRVDPGDPFDGVGWGDLTGGDRVDAEYKIFGRSQMLAEHSVDSGTGDNGPGKQELHSRIADNMWPY